MIDFIYVTDSKGADMENLDHIADHSGKFISVMPLAGKLKIFMIILKVLTSLGLKVIVMKIVAKKVNSQPTKPLKPKAVTIPGLCGYIV